ncbi:RICIN domain-containing protein [Streptomyces sp. SCA3-4]|uniref:RICIN domain-containing protein n=1 Tax=Streptomyces sichuanensis TaxID=2871810 RepID=UPI001CE2A2E8|nr:RICIN domain-containing protein [Streptomyces sichuanensis]MCA6095514.1 RICIN domain-containing protein [Streptomyces sichuanensis]
MQFFTKLTAMATASAAVVLATSTVSWADVVPVPPAAVTNTNSRLCLVVENGGKADGARAFQGDCGAGHWKIRWAGTAERSGSDPNGPVTFTNEYRITHTDSGKCLEIADSRKDDGAPAQLWDCREGLKTQLWELDPQNPGRIVNRNSGKALEVENSSLRPGAHVQQWTKTRTAAGQVWRWTLS